MHIFINVLCSSLPCADFHVSIFSRWERMNHLFLNFCPTLLQQLLILSHIRFIHFTNQYVETKWVQFTPINLYPFLIFLKTLFWLTAQVGHMIQAESDNAKRDEYLKRLMSLPNQVLCFYCSMRFASLLLSIACSLHMILTWLHFDLWFYYRNGQK